VEATTGQGPEGELQFDPLDARHLGATGQDVGEVEIDDLEPGPDAGHQLQRTDADVASQGLARPGLDQPAEGTHGQRDPEEDEREEDDERR
jgi:hypothetical protein